MLVFCVSIQHSLATAAAFATAGIPAMHIDGDTHRDIRAAAIVALGEGRLKIITSCQIFTEGVDCPGIGGIIGLRPTCSLGLHRQMIGRALRRAPGKKTALVFDHAGNTLRHGLYDAPIEWSLAGRQRAQRDEANAAPVLRCPECGLASSLNTTACPGCGHVFATVRRGRIPETRAGELERIDDKLTFALRQMSYRTLLRWAGADAERLTAAALARGYKPGWVRMRQFEHLEELRRAGEGAI
jgi:superfamily II DNA or RNA helicase